MDGKTILGNRYTSLQNRTSSQPPLIAKRLKSFAYKALFTDGAVDFRHLKLAQRTSTKRTGLREATTRLVVLR